MSKLILNINSIFQLIFSVIFFVIILFALFPKDRSKRNIPWLICAASFFLFFIMQFLNAIAPSSSFSEKVMNLETYNVVALTFLYPYCITMTMKGTVKNNRIPLAVIFVLQPGAARPLDKLSQDLWPDQRPGDHLAAGIISWRNQRHEWLR